MQLQELLRCQSITSTPFGIFLQSSPVSCLTRRSLASSSMAWQPHRVCLTLEVWLCQQSRTRQLDTPVMECMDRTECSIHFSQSRLRAHSSAFILLFQLRPCRLRYIHFQVKLYT